MNETLRRCPFCGGDAELKVVNVWGAQSATVGCLQCHIRTAPISEGLYNSYRGERDKHLTLSEAMTEAEKRWNTRAEVAV